MNASMIGATKVALLTALIAVVGTLWIANLGQSEPVEAAFTPPDACSEDGMTVNAAVAEGGDSLHGSMPYSYWKRVCAYRTRERWACNWVYTSSSTGSARERVCGWRTFGWRDCRWILFYR